MELLLSVAAGGLGMIQIGSYRDQGIGNENEFGVASRILRIRSILGRLYMGLGVREWKYWGSEVGDLTSLGVWL
jgi:hypothetical protein